jgi:hypothetical protein
MSHWPHVTRTSRDILISREACPPRARVQRRAVEPDEILSLDKDAPDSRPPERPERGMVVQIPEVGGLHNRYVRRAA